VAATNKVLRTTELLEAILLYVDFKTLLLSQRVDRAWQDTIKASTMLQKKLFFLPVASFEEAEQLGIPGDEDYLALSKAVPGENGRLALINPLLFRHREHSESELRECAHVTDHISLAKRILPDTISARRGKSSWERMYFYQPPQLDEQRAKIYPNTYLHEGRKHDPIFLDETGWDHDFKGAGNKSLRQLMDVIEERIIEGTGYSVDWLVSEFRHKGIVISYADWKDGEHEQWVNADDGFDDSDDSDDDL
jgi:hypothetical protein